MWMTTSRSATSPCSWAASTTGARPAGWRRMRQSAGCSASATKSRPPSTRAKTPPLAEPWASLLNQADPVRGLGSSAVLDGPTTRRRDARRPVITSVCRHPTGSGAMGVLNEVIHAEADRADGADTDGGCFGSFLCAHVAVHQFTRRAGTGDSSTSADFRNEPRPRQSLAYATCSSAESWLKCRILPRRIVVARRLAPVLGSAGLRACRCDRKSVRDSGINQVFDLIGSGRYRARACRSISSSCRRNCALAGCG